MVPAPQHDLPSAGASVWGGEERPKFRPVPGCPGRAFSRVCWAETGLGRALDWQRVARAPPACGTCSGLSRLAAWAAARHLWGWRWWPCLSARLEESRQGCGRGHGPRGQVAPAPSAVAEPLLTSDPPELCAAEGAGGGGSVGGDTVTPHSLAGRKDDPPPRLGQGSAASAVGDPATTVSPGQRPSQAADPQGMRAQCRGQSEAACTAAGGRASAVALGARSSEPRPPFRRGPGGSGTWGLGDSGTRVSDSDAARSATCHGGLRPRRCLPVRPPGWRL